MEKEFVGYDQALKLKELGLDELCIMAYFKYTSFSSSSKMKIELYRPLDRIYGENYFFKNSSEEFSDDNVRGLKDGDGAKCSAPTFHQVFRWFRLEHGLDITIAPTADYNGVTNGYYYEIMANELCKSKVEVESKSFKTHEEAELECLNELIDIIKNELKKDK
jgi:hypothetical protein